MSLKRAGYEPFSAGCDPPLDRRKNCGSDMRDQNVASGTDRLPGFESSNG